MEQTIYIDVLLSINLFINYFLLLSVKCFFHLRTSRLRLILGAIVGAGSSLIILLPKINEFLLLVIALIISALIIFASFFPVDKIAFIKAAIAFYFFNFSYAGIMLFIWYFISPQLVMIKNNIVYFKVSPLLLCLLTVITYFTVNLINKVMGKREADELFCKAQIVLAEKEFEVYCKIDTGNSLKEPFSQNPVVVIYFPAINILNLPYRIIPYRDISGGGILKAYSVDRIKIRIKDTEIENKNCYVAFTDNSFGSGFNALINPEIISEGVILNEHIN